MNKKLTISHNAGLFSCFTQALQALMMHYNYYGAMPPIIDRGHQFVHYKSHPEENLIPMLFEDDCLIPLEEGRQYFMSNDPREQQFSDYKQLRFNDLQPFINRWFTPGIQVKNRVADFKSKYAINTTDTIAVFHRANDKVKETKVAHDDEWIAKIKEVIGLHFGKKLFILPDNIEFAQRCRDEFGDVVIIAENHLYHADANGCNFMKVPLAERPQHALNFYSSVLIASECDQLITHSGNGGFWSVLYRGHTNGLYQYLNGEWL